MSEKKERKVEGLDWENETVFKDTVLGYIGVPKAVVDTLIDHKIFQRLHDVAQTGMETLYPGATHNRFCHSVGVYHLGKMAFQSFQKNVKNQHCDDIYYGVADKPSECERVWNRWRFLFEMACLLHDCGHSPLSHSLEFLYDSNERMNTGISRQYRSSDQLLLEEFKGNKDFCDHFYKETAHTPRTAYGAQHERMSGYLIMNEYGYRKILYKLIQDQQARFDAIYQRSRSEEGTQAYTEYDENMLQSDLEFMVRAIIGYPYGEQSHFWGEEEKHRDIVIQLRNCIIRLLNGTIDVDNIDYSIRDASASGYKSAQVDYERLLKSETIALAYEHLDSKLHLRNVPFDYLIRLYHFHSDPVESEPLSMTISGSATLLVNWTPDGHSQEDGGLHITGEIIEDDNTCSEKNVRVIHIKQGSNAHIILKHGSLTISPRNQAGAFTQLYIRSDSLSGELSGMIFVGNGNGKSRTEEEPELLKEIKCGKVWLFPAYHKSALSVIQGALDATNFESKWIYSHHVTTYRNNFLSIFLLEKFSDYQFEQDYSSLFSQLEQFLALASKFLGQGVPKMESDDSVLHKLRSTKESLNNTSKKGVGAHNLPDDLSAFPTQAGIDICDTLLDALCVLYRGMPIESSGGVEARLQSGFQRAIQQISCFLCNPPLAAEKDPSSVERRIFTDLAQQIRTHEGHSIGMGTMSALLGMPDPTRVNGHIFFRSSDSDLQSMYHNLPFNSTETERNTHRDLFYAIEQYESRQYLTPMWKSHAEFHFYIHGWKEQWFRPENPQNSNSCSLIESFFDSNNMPVSQYTYFSDSAVTAYSKALNDFWNTIKNKFHLDILVYAPQKIRHKTLTSDNTYVVWKNRIVTLQDIGLEASKAQGHSYFYLYYRQTKGADEEEELDVCEFMDVLKDMLNKWEEEKLSAREGNPKNPGNPKSEESQ